MVKDDIVIGGQANPNVKITRQGKGIRIGQSSQVNAQQQPPGSGQADSGKNSGETPAAKYNSINSSSQPSKMMMGMSPRLASINSGADVGIVPNH